MRTWNIGNTTVRNPQRIGEALLLFVRKMSGRPFAKDQQLEFQGELIDAGLIDSARRDGDDGARKFAGAFKQLGFITDWSRGKIWTVTDVGENYLAHPETEDYTFLRQLLKYQLPSPLEESRTRGFAVRPFRLLLKILLKAHEENLVGLTKFEIGLFVITLTTENEKAFEQAISDIKEFRKRYENIIGKVKKNRFAHELFKEKAAVVGLVPGTLLDYADSNARYASMSGLLTLKGNKLVVAEARKPLIAAILVDQTTLLANDEYLPVFYDPTLPLLPTDNAGFLDTETFALWAKVKQISDEIKEPIAVPAPIAGSSFLELQAAERRLREELVRIREIKFYREQKLDKSLDEIEQLLEDVRDNNLVGGQFYAPAFFEWAIWRLFLAINDLEGEISKTRGFKVDEDIRPIHHAKGGAADLTFTYADFKLVCEMTLSSGSRQFAMEGEPVTRHVFKAIEESGGKAVYGLFVARRLDPNTVDAFHNARYWRNWEVSVSTPVVAINIDQALTLLRRVKNSKGLSAEGFRKILDEILKLQLDSENGSVWYKNYSDYYRIKFTDSKN